MMTPLSEETLDAIAACGFAVYQNTDPHWRSYAFFTDGNHIGYLQPGWFGGVDISTVHMPNPRSGTGFGMGPVERINREDLSLAFVLAPHWADRDSVVSVRKWASIDAMIASNHKNLVKVREGVVA
jgi:hypothetical protein